MLSWRGTRVSWPAGDQRASWPAPGNHGMVASTSTSQRRPSAASCCRLNGADSGSTALGKILVTARTRIGSSTPRKDAEARSKLQRLLPLGRSARDASPVLVLVLVLVAVLVTRG